jgi:hypothetical protein
MQRGLTLPPHELEITIKQVNALGDYLMPLLSKRDAKGTYTKFYSTETNSSTNALLVCIGIPCKVRISV